MLFENLVVNKYIDLGKASTVALQHDRIFDLAHFPYGRGVYEYYLQHMSFPSLSEVPS